MKQVIKKFLAITLCSLIIASTVPLQTLAAPIANPSGTGGVGPYVVRGTYVSVFSVTDGVPAATMSKWRTERAPNGAAYKSLSDYLAFTAMSKASGIQEINRDWETSNKGTFFISSEKISNKTNIHYLLGTSGWNLEVVPSLKAFNVRGLTVDNAYKQPGGLVNHAGVPTYGSALQALFKVTDNGKKWDATAINGVLKDFWTNQVSSASPSAAWNGLKDQWRSIFYGYGLGSTTTDDLVAGVALINKSFSDESTKPGSTYYGVTVMNEQHGSNLRNLALLQIMMVAANPGNAGEGTYWKVDKDKPNPTAELADSRTLYSKLNTWVNEGGNCDTNMKRHLGLRLTSFAVKDHGGKFAAERWDYAIANGTTGGSLFDFKHPILSSKDKNNWTHGQDYGSNPNGFMKSLAQNQVKINPRINARAGDSAWSAQSIFNNFIINSSGKVVQTDTSSSGGSGFKWKGVLEYREPKYAPNTINTGATFLLPGGPNKGDNGAADRPNFRHNATVFSDTQEVAENIKGEATVYFSPVFPQPLSQDTRNSNNVSNELWNPTKKEVDSLLSVIDRIQNDSAGEMVASGTDSKLLSLPTAITVKRSIVNGSSTGKIIDDEMRGAMQISNCGKHDYKITENTASRAVISFNIIPSSPCAEQFQHSFSSPINEFLKKKDTTVKYNNCAVSWLFGAEMSRIKFKDSDIEVTPTAFGKTTVNYDFSMKVSQPTFVVKPEIYGDLNNDKMQKGGSNYTSVGHSVLPGVKPNGKAYPLTDYNASGPSFEGNADIRRSITFTRTGPSPNYTNFGYDKKHPPYAEIKTGGPKNEPFEAMSGTPTTRDLYTSIGGTDFLVDFNAQTKEVKNGATQRTYTYTYTVNDCWGADSPCTFSDPPIHHDSCSHGSKPSVCSPNSCGASISCGRWSGTGCQTSHASENKEHSKTHTYTYTLNMPIDDFSYFDMQNSEVWRMSQWGLKNGDQSKLLTSPNPTFSMNTGFWGFNGQNYSSGNGRILFSNVQTGNTDGTNAPWGDNKRADSLSHSAASCEAGAKKAMDKVNGYVGALPNVKATVISDYIVLKTSEGYQVPYYFAQETNEVSPNSVKFTSPTGDSKTLTTKMKVPKVLTMDDFWWKNTAKNQAATKTNGWHNASITYGGYNGKYQDLNGKYINEEHSAFLRNDNPLEKTLTANKLSITSVFPNQIKGGPASNTIGRNASNSEHIKTGLDVIDTAINGEYNTGTAWSQYNREMFYQNNSNYGGTSGTGGKFPMTGGGVFINDNIPYYDGAAKVNDIVIHDPVSAQYSLVVSNDPKYDKRTDAELYQGGDPPNLDPGFCPTQGCTYSTLTCGKSLEEHKTSCYIDVETSKTHNGGSNSHVHTPGCYHTHTESCKAVINPLPPPPPPPPVVTCTTPANWCFCANERVPHGLSAKWYKAVGTFGCGETGHFHTGNLHRAPEPPPLVLPPQPVVCNYCDHCGDPRCANYCPNHAYPCSASCLIQNPPNICGKNEGTIGNCNNLMNNHTCVTCTVTKEKVLNCSDPHHYLPGEPTDAKSPKYHYAVGDNRCWTRCGIDSNHGTKSEVVLPDGGKAKPGGTFINLDREFQIYFPFLGDFAEAPGLQGIKDTTSVRGKGYTNSMSTREWTEHRWVNFPFHVIDPKGQMQLAFTNIDLNAYSTTDEIFNFYCVLANDEASLTGVLFNAVAINAPTGNKNDYYEDSLGDTNRERIDDVFAARHTASKIHYIDIIGSLGSLTINDTGDYRFSNLFKQPKTDGSFLIPNLVPEVYLNRPNKVVTDNITSRLDPMNAKTIWQSTYGLLNNVEGGKSKEPLLLPLTPKLNNIVALKNQPMRPGYQLYMDMETIGNYYGTTVNEDNDKYLDSTMIQKNQVRPMYYSLDLKTGKYTPVDVYYGVNGEYMQVNTFKYKHEPDAVGVQEYYYYLDWLNESSRRNFTNAENKATIDVKAMKDLPPTFLYRSPILDREILGSANVLFLNDLDRTFVGSSKTYGVDKNPDKQLQEVKYSSQSQRWHFTLGLPSSSVFVESGEPCTDVNIKKLQSNDKVIVCALDIKVQGEVWTLDYDGLPLNMNGFQITEGGKVYPPPKFDDKGVETTDPKKDVTSDDPIVVIYPSNKTSKDDVISSGIQ